MSLLKLTMSQWLQACEVGESNIVVQQGNILLESCLLVYVSDDKQRVALHITESASRHSELRLEAITKVTNVKGEKLRLYVISIALGSDFAEITLEFRGI